MTRQAGGTGLGLVIVKSIIELLGGAIWVHSEPGRGSKFYFTLPVCVERRHSLSNEAETDEAGSAPVPERGLGLVLVIDAGSHVRETIQHSLHRRGYGVVVAGTLQEAQSKARLHKPDVVLLDIMMDHCIGFSILSSLLDDPATAALPIIALSLDSDGSGEKITMGALSFSPVKPNVPEVVSLLNSRRARIARSPLVLLVSFSDETNPAAKDAAASLLEADVNATVAAGAADAINQIVVELPDAIIAFVDNIDDKMLHGFLTAIKSENDFARIPVVVATNSVSGDDILFHFGDVDPDVRPSVDYLAEQVAVVLRSNSYGLDPTHSDHGGLSSGILKDN